APLGHVAEDALEHFVPPDRGDADHRRRFRDLKGELPRLNQSLKSRGVPGLFLDLEPHLKGGGQFGGFSGPDGYGVALRALCAVLYDAGLYCYLTEFDELRRTPRPYPGRTASSISTAAPS